MVQLKKAQITNMNKFYKIICWLFISIYAFSCQQMPDEEYIDSTETESLTVEVRSAEDDKNYYPFYIYAFNQNGKLAASQTINDESEEIKLPITRGDYKIVAFAGISSKYQFPENPSLDDVIVLTSDCGAETPLLMGKADVNLSRSAENKVKLTLTHVVAALNVTLKNVPADVVDVQLTLSPLYSSLTMGGEYVGNSHKVRIDCDSNIPGNWSSETTYIFPGSGKEIVFSILFKLSNGSEVVYGYTSKGVPEPNKPFNVTGSYSDGVIVGGSFDVNDWDEAINVEFEFGGNVVPDNKEDEDENLPDTDLVGVPKIGSIWNDMIVVDKADAENGAVELLLMSLDEWEIITSQADDVISGYSVNNISEWRLPTHDEAAVLRARFSGNNRLNLNDLIANYDDELYGLAAGSEERYLCMKEGEYYSFQFIGGTRTTKAGSKRSYYLRLVKNYKFVANE